MTDIRFNGLTGLQKFLRRTSNFRVARVALHEEVSSIWADAAEAFVRAAMRKILVDTGMSAASFLALAREIRSAGAEEAISNALNRRKHPAGKKGIPEFPDGDRSQGRQGLKEGIKRGRKAYTYQTGSPNRFLFRFSFQTVVYQHAFWEDRTNTINAGLAAFRQVVADRLGPAAEAALEQWITGRKIVPTARGQKARPT